MTEREFCYWLQGLFEIGDLKALDERQTEVVRDHLKLVFRKVTPDRVRDDIARRTLADSLTAAAYSAPNMGVGISKC